MTDHDEATARYNALLAELETANARAAEAPDDTELAAAAHDAYDRAQAAYADVLAAYGGEQVEEQISESNPEEQSDVDLPDAVADADADATPDAEDRDETPVTAAPAAQAPVSTIAPAPVASEYDLGDFGAPATVAAPAFGEDVPEGVFVLTRKPVATRFVPSDTPIEELTPISRSLLPQRAKGQRSELSRERNIAGDLPEWSPLPPGEVVAVKRAGATKKS